MEFRCKICDKRFAKRSIFVLHNKTLHKQTSGLYKCQKCPNTYKVFKALTDHMNIHLADKCVVCKVCEKKCTTDYHLEVHMRTHTNEKPFKCTTCNKRFTGGGSLKTHKQRVHHQANSCIRACFVISSLLLKSR